ncbi:MAG: C-terminal target protein [Flavipsychrobacter sp.]|nr:C-terminal target protein [Flavipsychrobacter sp.]
MISFKPNVMNLSLLSKLLVIAVILSWGAIGASAQTFSYTGSTVLFTIPFGVNMIQIDAVGGNGGNGQGGNGGNGGRVQCYMAVTAGTVLYANIGGAGQNYILSGTPTSGGYNGGGNGSGFGGGGGGATDIRMGGTALANRIVIAGAGGGGGYNCSTGHQGGCAGGLSGSNGLSCAVYDTAQCGAGGTQITGGHTASGGFGATTGSLGLGGSSNSSGYNGGGGGGYYGGGEGWFGVGGGGSSYADPTRVTSVVLTSCYNSGSNGSLTITSYLATPITGTTSICLGSVSTLTNATGGGTWTSSNTSIAVIGSSNGVVSPVSVGTTTITYKSLGAIATATVTIKAAPTAIIGISSICLNSTATFSDATSGGSWTSSNTAVCSINPTTGFDTFINAGTTTITYTIPTGCFTTQTVTSLPLPSPDTITGGGVYCSAGPGVHIRTKHSLSGYSYRLYLGGSLVATNAGTGSSVDFGTFTTAGTYTGTITNIATGCVNTMSGSATIISAAPLNVYSLSSGGSYCASGTGIHIILSYSDVGVTYTLFNSGLPVSALPGINGPLDFGLITPGGTYTVTATNITGCAANMTGSAVITVNPLPVRYVLSGGGGYCSGGSGASLSLAHSDPGINYQLYRGAAPVISYAGTGLPLTFGPYTTAGTYMIIATDAATGCTDTMTGFPIIFTNPLPPIDTVIGGGAYCSGGPGIAIGLDASTTGVNYTLMLSGSPVTTAAGTGTTINFGLQTTAGKYNVVAVNATTGCTSNMYDSGVVSILPSVTPSVSFTSIPGDTVCPGSSVSFSASPVSGGTTPAYQWKINGTVVPGATNATYSYTPAGSDVITITMTSSASCAVPSGVSSTRPLVYNYVPAISGSMSVCVGATAALTDTASGGTWSSMDMSVVTIATIGGSIGVSSGISAGTSTVTYMLTSGCYAVTTITVLPAPSVFANYSSACGDVYTLNGTGGVSYSWDPTTGLSCPTCATTDVSPTTTTVYTVTGTDADGCANTATVGLNGNRIYGHITFSSLAPDTLDMKVWLIQFNSTDSSIAALDSTLTCTVDSTGYFEFNSKPAGNYMVKANLLHGNAAGMSGYLPTYSSSTANWYLAATAAHVSSSDVLDINMIYGTVPTGPGFIGGYVYSGAGKGTGDAPATGMLIYLRDLASNVLTHVYTDATGRYAFNNLAYGNYVVYPEQYDYNTISSDFITLSPSSLTIDNISFRRFTLSRIIKPFIIPQIAGVKSVNATNGINVFPNPSNGVLNIQWQNQQTGIATVVITDMVGREVYHSALNVYETSGSSAIDLKGLNDGIYLISITSGTINYSAKLFIQK